MKTFPFMLAWRYLWSANREPSISTMIRICFLGILLGTLSLALTLSIMQGFEQTTKEKLQNINPSILIRSTGKPLNVEKIENVLTKEFPEIIASAPTTQQYVIIKDKDNSLFNSALLLKGIDPEKEIRVTAIDKKIVEPNQASPDQALPDNEPLTQMLYDNRIIIGSKLAEQLNLDIGDSLTLVYMPTNKASRAKEVDVIINGLFKTGIEDFDLSLALANLDFVQELFPEQGITEIGLKIQPHADETLIVEKLRDLLPLDIVSWQDLYPAIVSALKLEKYLMFFIIALITLVASMNIISLLFMQITQKRGDIAIIRSFGLPFSQTRTVFLVIGLAIGFTGSLGGLLIAFVVGFILKTYPFITLPDVYYTTYLPISLNPLIFLIVFVVVMIITLIATLIPLKMIKNINIANVLRFEG